MLKNMRIVSILACVVLPLSLQAAEYDIVINNGRVMDPETSFDAKRNVGIKDGKIAIITEDTISGRQVIDASDHVVAPGFIDTHTHSSDKYVIKMAMMDGVTSGMDYELGGLNIGAWYDREQGKWPINYGQCVAHEMVRVAVHDGIEIDDPVDAVDAFKLRAESAKDEIEGWSVTVSDLEQINQINKRLDENLRQGALCVGTTLGYAPKGISTYEMFEVQKTAARYGRPIASHTRFHGGAKPPTEAQMGFAEIFTNAALLKAPLLYSHNNDYGWWEIEEKLKLARAQGMNMWAEYYPYEAASTAIGAVPLRPESIEGVLGLKYKDILYDPTQDKYLDKQEYLQVAKDDPGRTIVIFNPARKKWLPMWLRVPHMVVGSDSMWQNEGLGWEDDPAKFKGHPRTSGSHSITLRLARENGVPLMHTLAQLSYWSAYHLGKTGLKMMQERGRLQQGMAADIVVFDPENVREGSGYKAGENGLPPIGLPHVIVNGQFVKKDDKATNIMAGLPVLYPVEDKPRHVEATQEQWQSDILIDDGAIRRRPRPEKTGALGSGRKLATAIDPLQNDSLHSLFCTLHPSSAFQVTSFSKEN
jgi:cytosine/adenosine deaminase-related metal-dependent hydrolase